MATPYRPEDPPEAAILYISSTITIAAPAAHVAALFMDTATWPAWNRFVPKAELEHADAADTSALIRLDDTMHLYVQLKPGQPLHKQTMTVTEVTAGGAAVGDMHVARWSVKGYPSFVLRSNRVSQVEVLGDAECAFRTWDAISGTGARIAKAIQPGEAVLQERFLEHANDLKAYAEKTWAEKKGAAAAA